MVLNLKLGTTMIDSQIDCTCLWRRGAGKRALATIALCICGWTGEPSFAATLQISPQQAEQVGRRVWQNESGGTIQGLTAWNKGEDFASLGIGHFIWYPKDKRGPFEESFPGLVRYLERSGVRLPQGARLDGACPWDSRDEFMRDFDSVEMKAIRDLLARTVPEQARFLAMRLEEALSKMLAHTDRKAHVEKQFYKLAQSAQGLYAMMDYVNFKGEGTSATERYEGEGWGLLQVLEGMNESGDAPREFARSADRVLTRRVKNAPASRGEERWLPGWRNRLKTY